MKHHTMKHLLTRYRQHINPPYKGKDYLVLGMIIFVLFALALLVFFAQKQTNTQDYAATAPLLPTPAQQHAFLHGKEFFPPVAATDPSLVARGAKGSPNEKHGLGLLAPTPMMLGMAPTSNGSTKGGGGGGGKTKPTATPTKTTISSTPTPILNLPTSVDLSQYDVPVGNQGGVGSCVAWAIDYSQRGWYATRDGYFNPLPSISTGTGSFAPMYTYAQIVKGVNEGTDFEAHYAILESQGVDTRADYFQGDDDYTDQPVPSEITNAASYRISGYKNLIGYPYTGTTQQAIESAMAAGDPVVIGFEVYSNFSLAGPTSYYIDVPPAGSIDYGGHAVMAVKYDKNGLWIQNQWGTFWGLNGYAELSWNFVNNNNYLWQAITMQPITPSITMPPTSYTPPPFPATPTLTPTFGPSPTPTMAPVAPTVSINAPGCINEPVSNTNTVTISWTNSNVQFVELGSSSINTNAYVGGKSSIQMPAGFPNVTLVPGTQYWAGVSPDGIHWSGNTYFTVPLCPTATP